jgi:hypothetical protein
LLEIARHEGRSISLITPEGASRMMGAAWFAALQDLLMALGPEEIIYDCGNHTGDVLAAFRHGISRIRIDPAIHTPTLADLATKYAVTLYTERDASH